MFARAYSRLKGALFFSVYGVAVFVMAMGACEQGRPGKPLADESFYFPTGIAIHPDGFALVASANFDLMYKSGTVRVIDLNTLASRLAANNYDIVENGTDDKGNPIKKYYRDLILDDFAVSVGSFAGKIVISSDNTFAAVTIRETNELIVIDLTAVTDSTDPAHPTLKLKMTCFPDDTSNSGKKFRSCSGSRNVIQLDRSDLQFDPFGIALVEEDLLEGIKATAYISFLRSGRVSKVEIPIERATDLIPVSGPFTESAALNDVIYSPLSKKIYLSSRSLTSGNNFIFSYNTPWPSDEAAKIASLDSNDLYSVFLGTETRGLVFSNDGSTLAVVVLNPNMLVFLDAMNGLAYGGSVPLGKNPSLVHRNAHNDQDLFFVTCAQEDSIYLIDGKKKRLVNVLKHQDTNKDESGTTIIKDEDNLCKGPFDIGFFDNDGSNIHWALLTCFEEDTVTVLDVDPSSPRYLKVIAKVGTPREE